MLVDEDVQRIAESRVGRVLKGKYRLDRVLGTGGMATVYVATHRNQKELAIKMLHPELSIRENVRKRFLREGYVANSVKHPGAVAVLDDDVAEDGSAFLVMELLEGSTLEAIWEKRGRRLGAPTALAVADQLLDVLVAAHSKGIVHRDIKPPNLFLTRDGVLKVLDFGIARLRDAGGVGTQTGAMLGTPAFMAPEQALAKASEIDAQTDLWAVGATLFQMLSGRLVHEGDNAHQLLVSAARDKARSLASVAPDVPVPVAAVIDKALAFEKKDRWASAREMREGVRTAHQAVYGSALVPLARTSSSSVLGTEIEEPAGDVRSATGSWPSQDPTWDATEAAEARGIGPRDAVGARSGTEVAPTVDVPAKGLKVSTSVGVEGDAAAREGGRARRVWSIAAALLVGAGVTATVVSQRAGRGAAATAASAGAASAPEPIAPSAVQEVKTAPAAPQAVTPPIVTSAPSAPVETPPRSPATSPRAGKPGPVRPAAAPSTTPPPSSSAVRAPAASAAVAAPTPAPKAAPNCDPPYTTDKEGIQHPKPECL